MKTLKKAVSLLLAIFMMGSIAVISAGAAEQEQQPDMDALRQKFKIYLEEKGINDYNLSSVSLIMVSNTWTIFFGHPGYETPIFTSERIGKYIFFSENVYAPYALGLYAEKEGRILTLKEAYEQEKINIDEIAASKKSHITVYQPGDTDMNGNVAITDVLNVQKVIAKESAIDSYYATFNLYDYDGDETITVKDVLGMQNQIAKITDGPI